MEIVSGLHMWVTLAVVVGVVILYMTEWVPLEITSLGVLFVLMLFFFLFPLTDVDGAVLLAPERLLRGFANPALITVLALLVVGEALVRTGALESIAKVLDRSGIPKIAALVATLFVVLASSAFLNNTPVVIIFIPIMQALCERYNENPSRLMMPLSFAAILGGMTTLIGSSTNLLVSSVLIEKDRPGLGFFEFTPIALILAGAGIVYVILVLPRLLKERASLASQLSGQGRQFVSQIVVPEDSELIGNTAVAGFFPGLPEITVRMIQRGSHAVLPPFENFTLQAGDVLIVAATRKALSTAAKRHPGLFHPPMQGEKDGGRARQRKQIPNEVKDPDGAVEELMAEAMVMPSSRIIGMNLAQIGFRHRYGVVVLGIQRRARMIRQRMTEIRLEAGDVLLIQGTREHVNALRADRDMVLLSGSFASLPKPHHAGRAVTVFLVAVGLAALDLVPILITALGASIIMILMGALNIRQAVRALDRKIVFLVAAGLAMADALQVTGGAAYVAQSLIQALGTASAPVLISAFFLVVALFTNILSNNATALLFTPIGISLAYQIGVDPRILAITVVLAANCSFASPVGYQTNLLVMGPGRYNFADFVRGGLPLTLFLWVIFSLVAPWYWGL